MKTVRRILTFVFLTLMTQVGGAIYILCLPLSQLVTKRVKNPFAILGIKVVSFVCVYLVICLTAVPIIAGKCGRVPLPISASGLIRPNSIATCLLNRNYVRKELLDAIKRTSARLRSDNEQMPVYYLDAGFPFIDGWPLLPHLSHNDGKKIDLSYYYLNKDDPSEYRGSPSWIGYGLCEQPEAGEYNMPCECAKKGYHRYSMLRYLVPSSLHKKYEAEGTATAKLIRAFAADQAVSTIFLEPHLIKRWQLTDVGKIKYHGCHAVRHDDHVHIQIR